MGHALFLSLTAAALWEAYLLARLVDRDRSHATCVLFAAVVAMAELVVAVQIAALFRLMTPSGLAILVALGLLVQGAAIAIRWRSRPPAPMPMTGADGVLWLVALLASLQAIAYAGPTIYHDGMTYHLTFAVEWLQHGNLAAPFQAYGDLPAPFYPIDSSLLYLWAMALPGSDFWARLVQAPFVVVIAAALVSLIRSLGGRAPAPLVAVAVLATVPILRGAHRDQGNDVVVAALLLAALAFLAQASTARSTLALAGFPLAVALATGSKLVALVYLPLPVALYLWSIVRRREWRWLGWLVLALLALGSFSYAKNWHVTGSALYPASFGVPGLRAREVLLDPFAHSYGRLCHSYGEVSDVFGAVWAIVVAGAVIVWMRGLRSGWRSVETLLVVTATLSVAAFHGVVPYRHCRLLLFPFLALVPIVACGVAALRVFDSPLAGRLDRTLGRAATPLFALACAVLVACSIRIPGYELTKYDVWSARPVAGRRYGAGWRYLRDRERANGPLRIAMSATQNVPYPLYGPTFANTVFYVPRDGRAESLHYDLAARALYPFHKISESEWRRAIQSLKPTHLFNAVDMGGLGFGEEDAWAAKDPATFALVYQDPEVRIYEVRRP